MTRMMKLTVAGLLLAGSIACAESRRAPLPTMVERSDLIGQVEILSTTRRVAPPVASDTGASGERPLKDGEYKSQAEVKVIHSIKGLKAGETYILEFDNGYACPDVWYQTGEQCLVFNRKMTNGHYETPDTDSGKYMMQGNSVVNWKANSKQATPLGEVADEITKIMQAPRQPKSEMGGGREEFVNP